MQTEQDQIRAYREQVLNADTIEQLQAIAVDMIGHCDGFYDDDTRADLLDYLSEWELDLRRRDYSIGLSCVTVDAPLPAAYMVPAGSTFNAEDLAQKNGFAADRIGADDVAMVECAVRDLKPGQFLMVEFTVFDEFGQLDSIA